MAARRRWSRHSVGDKRWHRSARPAREWRSMIACREQRADVDRQRSPRPAYRADETQPQQGRYSNRHKFVVTVESHLVKELSRTMSRTQQLSAALARRRRTQPPVSAGKGCKRVPPRSRDERSGSGRSSQRARRPLRHAGMGHLGSDRCSLRDNGVTRVFGAGPCTPASQGDAQPQ